MKNIIQSYWGKNTKYEVKFYQSPFPVGAPFENKLFMATHIIGEEMKQIYKSHGGSLNHWAGVLIRITVKTFYELQYIRMRLSGYINAPTEPSCLNLKHVMEYLMHHPH